jgi:hypothetical protein
MKKATLTFKKQPKEKGLASVGYPYQCVDIKLDGEIVGMIDAPNCHTKGHEWRVSVAVVRIRTPGNPCPFTWFRVREVFSDEQTARQWVKDNTALIIDWGLYAPWGPYPV